MEQWSRRDQTLAQALTYLENQTNPEHGKPTWLSSDPLRDWAFEEQIDFVSAAMAQKIKRMQESDRDLAGISFQVIDKGIPDEIEMDD